MVYARTGVVKQKLCLFGRIMKEYTDIGARLRELRGSRSQKEFAAGIGIAFRSYQRYESGERSPSSVVIGKIAEACNVSADWIITGKLHDSIDNESKRRSEAKRRAELIIRIVDMLENEPKSVEEIIQTLIDEKIWNDLVLEGKKNSDN
jgi:transcriptional regulator with XRE-family HTH domain